MGVNSFIAHQCFRMLFPNWLLLNIFFGTFWPFNPSDIQHLHIFVTFLKGLFAFEISVTHSLVLVWPAPHCKQDLSLSKSIFVLCYALSFHPTSDPTESRPAPRSWVAKSCLTLFTNQSGFNKQLFKGVDCPVLVGFSLIVGRLVGGHGHFCFPMIGILGWWTNIFKPLVRKQCT